MCSVYKAGAWAPAFVHRYSTCASPVTPRPTRPWLPSLGDRAGSNNQGMAVQQGLQTLPQTLLCARAQTHMHPRKRTCTHPHVCSHKHTPLEILREQYVKCVRRWRILPSLGDRAGSNQGMAVQQGLQTLPQTLLCARAQTHIHPRKRTCTHPHVCSHKHTPLKILREQY
jgi:hypothetical protein